MNFHEKHFKEQLIIFLKFNCFIKNIMKVTKIIYWHCIFFFFFFFFKSCVNKSKVPGRLGKGDVMRAKSNRVREGNDGQFQGRRKGKEKSWFIVLFGCNFIMSVGRNLSVMSFGCNLFIMSVGCSFEFDMSFGYTWYFITWTSCEMAVTWTFIMSLGCVLLICCFRSSQSTKPP